MAIRPHVKEMYLRIVADLEYSGAAIDCLMNMRRRGGFPMTCKKEVTNISVKGKKFYVDIITSCSANESIKQGPEWVKKMSDGYCPK